MHAQAQHIEQAVRSHEEKLYVREHKVAMGQLCGIEEATLEEICACDPAFFPKVWNLKRLLLLDTETTGLSGGAGTLAFEIGLGWFTEEGLTIRQIALRDYDQEKEMLGHLVDLLEGHDILVTYNGKSFDIPLLESRLILNGWRRDLRKLPHLDLLHCCRRVYGLRLQRCALKNMEEVILGKHRADDLPGAEAPGRFFDYLKTREFSLLQDVLSHNLEDVISLAQITGHLCSVYRKPQTLQCPEDLFGVAKMLEKAGKRLQAKEAYRLLGYSKLCAEGHYRLARLHRQDAEWDEATALWREMQRRSEGGIVPYLEIAKYYEHKLKDLPAALSCAMDGLNVLLSEAALSADWNAQDAQALRHRIERLQRKILVRQERRKDDGHSRESGRSACGR